MRPIHQYTLGLAILVLAVTGCFENPQQDASNVFASKTLPDLAEQAANPKPSANEIRSDFKLDVAVLDNGVDYLHPDLKKRIRFEKDREGRVVGAGFDPWAEDNWAFPTEIEPYIFAFGAHIDQNQKIANPLSDPLNKLSELNSIFVSALVARLKTTDLQIFKNQINENSISLLGIKFMLMRKGTYFKSNNTGTFDQYKLLGRQLGLPAEGEVVDLERPGTWQMLLQAPWTMSPVNGVPYLAHDAPFERIKGFDTFFDLAQSVYDDFNRAHSFEEKYLNPYLEFRLNQAPDRSMSTKSSLYIKYVRQLFEKWYKQVSGNMWDDPMSELLYRTCLHIDLPAYETLMDGTADERLETFVSHLYKTNSYLSDFMDHMQNNAIRTGSERMYAQKSLEFLEGRSTKPGFNIGSLMDFTFVDPDLMSCDFPARMKRYQSGLYSEYFKLAANPYNTNSSHSISHGTHVAGIVASQHEDLGIVPIRLFLEGIKTDEFENRELKDSFVRKFYSWLRLPSIAPAVVKLYKEKIGAASLDSKKADTELVEDILKEAQSRGVDDTVYENYKANHYFVNVLVKAIEYLGRQKIKVANLSVGSEVTIGREPFFDDKTQSILNFLSYLAFEHQKYRIGVSVQDNAKDTIFVIAAGNSAHWMDSLSRGALPCDISSQFLERYSPSKDIPNNQIENVICVGSLNEDEWLSSFTNIDLRLDPFILTRGEAIESSIRTGDLSGEALRLNNKYGADPLFPNTTLDEIEDVILKTRTLPEDEEEKTALKRFEMKKYYYATESVRHQVSTSHLINHLYGEAPQITAKMSGTSMASPRVAGFVGEHIINKMENLGIKDQKEIYTHEAFTPKTIINEIFNNAPRFGGNTRLSDLPKLSGLKEYNLNTNDLPPNREIEAMRKGPTFLLNLLP